MHYRLVYCFCLVLFHLANAAAQPPQITDINNYTAPVNGTITITGLNFSTTAEENRVFFGSVEAEVRSASSTSLTVVVPAGINYESLHVVVNGLVASSARPVTTSFDGSGAIDPTSFEGPEPLDANMSTFIDRILTDIDGDGKLDIIGRKDGVRGFMVARNTSDFAAGNISFADPVVFTIDSYARDIKVADMDGDGKPEVVILKNSSTATGDFVSIYKNRTIEGVIDASSFTTGFDFATVFEAEFFEIADLDLDGRRDLIVSNRTWTVGVHQNTSAFGMINTNSFAPLLQYTFAVSVATMKVGDMDGDARPEIVYSGSSGSQAFHIVKNNSITGLPLTTSSFGPHVAFGTSPHAVMMLADLNRDNMSEVITMQNVHPNNSAAGSFALGAPVDMLPGFGALFPVLNDYDGDGIADAIHIGEGNAIHAIRIPPSDNFSFERSINLDVALVALHVTSGDLNGDGRPDLLVTARNATTGALSLYVVRNRNSALPDPTITSIAPAMAAPGSVVTITGTNFGHVYDNNVVIFNGQELAVLGGTSTSLQVVIPAHAEPGYFTVKANNLKEVTAVQPLTIIHSPVINSFEPTVASAGTNITLWGEQFNANAGENIVFFGAVKADVIEASANTLVVKVPYGASYGPISVQVNGLTCKSTDPFTLSFPEGKTLSKHTFREFSLYANTNSFPSNAIKLSDIDSDGKTDIVICNTDEQSVVIYRNISTPGELSRHSFGEAVTIHSPFTNPTNIQVGDLDGDGRPDLAVLTSNSVSVYRNVSEPGTINVSSFETPFHFTIASFFQDFLLEDMDNDGKLDIIWSRWDSSLPSGGTQSTYPLWIVRNISRPGVLNAAMFEPEKHLFIPPSIFSNFMFADVNKDHLPDIIGMPGNSMYNRGRVFIFQNESTPANLQIGRYHSVSIEWETSDIAAGDLNNDGVIDLVGTDPFTQDAYVLSSQQQITDISSATYSRTSLAVNSIRVAISDMDGDGKADIILNDDKVKILKNVNTGLLNASAFSAPLVVATRQHAVCVGDLDGDGLNDLVGITPDSVLITHNINKSTPVINTFAPQSGVAGTEVVLTGENFSTTTFENIVRINGTTAHVVSASETMLTVTVPVDATSGKISVDVDGMTGTSANTFNVLQPQTIEFASISPKQFSIDVFVSLPRYSSAGLPITYSSSDKAVAYISGGDIRIAGAGTTTITASQEGNLSYAAATPVKRVLEVRKGIVAIQFVNDNFDDVIDPIFEEPVYVDASPFYVHPIAFGDATGYPNYVRLPVRITSHSPDVASVTDTLVTVHKPGSALITFAHDGNKDYEPYSVTHELVVKAYGQAITFDPIEVSCDAPGRTVELSATSTSGLPVTFASTNPTVASIEGSTAVIKSSGITSITAHQEGDKYYPQAEPVTRELLVDMQIQTITFTEIPVKQTKDDIFLIDAVSSSGLPVDLESTNAAVASVSGNWVTIHGAGETDLVARQPGNSCFLAADPVARKLTVVLVTSLETGFMGTATLFPNPTTGRVRVTSADMASPTHLRVMDAVGRALYEASIERPEESVDLSELPDGAYIVEISTAGTVTFRRLLKY